MSAPAARESRDTSLKTNQPERRPSPRAWRVSTKKRIHCNTRLLPWSPPTYQERGRHFFPLYCEREADSGSCDIWRGAWRRAVQRSCRAGWHCDWSPCRRAPSATSAAAGCNGGGWGYWFDAPGVSAERDNYSSCYNYDWKLWLLLIL